MARRHCFTPFLNEIIEQNEKHRKEQMDEMDYSRNEPVILLAPQAPVPITFSNLRTQNEATSKLKIGRLGASPIGAQMNNTETSEAKFATVWRHLDQLSDEDGNHHLNMAADTVEAVATALLADTPISRDVMARLLTKAAKTIRKGQNDIGAAIIELGDMNQT